MSYILDALRRADAERERGHVPGLHSRPAAVDPAGGRAPALRAGAVGVGAGAALALVALLVWRLGPGSAAPAGTPVALAPPPAVLPAAPAPVAAPSPVAPSRVDAASAARVVPTAPAVRRRTSAAVAPASAATPGTPPPAASAPAPVLRLEDLPDDIRRQLPVLAVGGSAYSASPASRFVIVNGQLFHEGDALAPGLVLEQIRFRSAVLAFKGYRYGIGF